MVISFYDSISSFIPQLKFSGKFLHLYEYKLGHIYTYLTNSKYRSRNDKKINIFFCSMKDEVRWNNLMLEHYFLLWNRVLYGVCHPKT